MIEHYDDNGDLVAMSSETPKPPIETPRVDFAYIRPCPLRRFPSELCVKHGDYYFVVAINREQLMNMLEAGTMQLREFDKRPIEDTEIG